jgi:hypothetical protein
VADSTLYLVETRSEWKLRTGGCHGRWLLVWLAPTEAVAKVLPTGAVQLSRGKRNLGRVCTGFAMVGIVLSCPKVGVLGRSGACEVVEPPFPLN